MKFTLRILACLIVSTTLLTPAFASTEEAQQAATYTIDQESRDSLVEMNEKARKHNEELDKAIVSAAILFGIPLGVTALTGLGLASYFSILACCHSRCCC
jgi:hypothetical protein